MTHPTDEELDALVFALDHLHPDDISSRDCSDAITALRAQLADALAERDNAVAIAADALTRANRADAERAVQIEVDADIALTYPVPIGCTKAAIEIASQITHQPHDRTALDRMLAEADRTGYQRAHDEFAQRQADIKRQNAYTAMWASCGTE